MPALQHLPDILAALRREGVSEEAIERYQARCFALSKPCYTLPCPHCFLSRQVAEDMTTVRSDPGQQQFFCTACQHQFNLTLQV